MPTSNRPSEKVEQQLLCSVYMISFNRRLTHCSCCRFVLFESSMNMFCHVGWLVFTELLETSRPYVREASMVPLYALLTFGGELEVLHDQGLLLLDGWAKFRAPARVGVLIKRLRHAVSHLLAIKVANPAFNVSNQSVIGALHQLLATDGF